MSLHVSNINLHVIEETYVNISYSYFIEKQILTDNGFFIIHFLHLWRHKLKALNLPLVEIITDEHMICAFSYFLFQSLQKTTEPTWRMIE